MIQNLSKRILITKVKGYSSADTAAINSDVIDMQGFDGVVFFTTINVANAGNHIKIQQGTTTSPTDDLLGTKVIVTGTNETVGVDVYKPLERYVRAVVTRTSSTICGEIYALQYEGRILPADNETAGTLNVELHISPDEGTA